MYIYIYITYTYIYIYMYIYIHAHIQQVLKKVARRFLLVTLKEKIAFSEMKLF